MKPIVRVRQKHELGCVPACVAMLAGLEYQECVKIVHPRRRKRERVWTSRRRMLSALHRLGFKVRERDVLDLRKLRNPAILGVKLDHPAFEGHLHAVLWDPSVRKVIDPYPAPNRLLKRHLALTTYQRGLLDVFEIVGRCRGST